MYRARPYDIQPETAREATWPYVDRRSGTDRRSRPTRMLSRHTFFGGQRVAGRRAGERSNCFVDYYGQRIFVFAAMILLLNVLDAFFTLFFLGVGGEEVNPVAQFMLDLSPMVFLIVKTIGIGMCTMYLVLVHNFKGANLGIGAVIAIYVLLLAWHVYLYVHAPVS